MLNLLAIGGGICRAGHTYTFGASDMNQGLCFVWVRVTQSLVVFMASYFDSPFRTFGFSFKLRNIYTKYM